jgi:hypothetical protein
MSVSVYVYVTPTWHCWLPFSTLPYSCIPFQIVKRTLCFFCFNYVVPWIHHIIINTPRASGLRFYPAITAAYGMCVFYFLYQKSELYFLIRWSDLDQSTVHTHSGPGPSFTCFILRRPSRRGSGNGQNAPYFIY